ncbi:hypothetical protein HMI56_003134, partial [Coelomomyces lativittatus]
MDATMITASPSSPSSTSSSSSSLTSTSSSSSSSTTTITTPKKDIPPLTPLVLSATPTHLPFSSSSTSPIPSSSSSSLTSFLSSPFTFLDESILTFPLREITTFRFQPSSSSPVRLTPFSTTLLYSTTPTTPTSTPTTTTTTTTPPRSTSPSRPSTHPRPPPLLTLEPPSSPSLLPLCAHPHYHHHQHQSVPCRPHVLVLPSPPSSLLSLLSTLDEDGRSRKWRTPLSFSLVSFPSPFQILGCHAFERTTYFNFSDIVSGKRRSTPHPRTGVSNCILMVTVQLPDLSYALQVYGTLATGTTLERRFFALASDCQRIPLHFKPLALTHVEIYDDRLEPSAMLVSGEGGYMWLFAEMPSTRKFVPVDLSIHFPILSQQKKTAYCIASYEQGRHQWLAIGYEDGHVLIYKTTPPSLVNNETNE